MLNKLNLLLGTTSGEDCIRRGMADRLGLDSAPVLNFLFNCSFASESAKKIIRHEEISGDIFTNKFSFFSFFTFKSYFIVFICSEQSCSKGNASSFYQVQI